MGGGWAGGVASTSRSTAGQDDHHVEDDHEINEEIEDDGDENDDEKEFDCDLLEHRLDPVAPVVPGFQPAVDQRWDLRDQVPQSPALLEGPLDVGSGRNSSFICQIPPNPKVFRGWGNWK